MNAKSISTRVYLHKHDKKDLSMSFPSMDSNHSTNPFYRVSNTHPWSFITFPKILKMTAKVLLKSHGKLPIVLITRDIKDVSHPGNRKLRRLSLSSHPGDLSRAILYFRGFGRRPIWKARQLFVRLGIASQAIQFVSFIGANVAELILLDSFKEDVVRRLATVEVKHDPSFDPLSPSSFTNATTVERLALAGKSGMERSVTARKVFVLRMDSMLQTIAEHRRGLRSFLRSLKKAVEDGAPTERFFNPIA
jgi:hypothetical protein